MMNISKPFTAALFGIAFATLSGAAMAQTVNGHRPSDHTMDSTNHGYEASYPGDGVRGPVMSGFSTISPRDRALQRLDDAKRQTSDAYISSAGPDGFGTGPGTRIR